MPSYRAKDKIKAKKNTLAIVDTGYDGFLCIDQQLAADLGIDGCPFIALRFGLGNGTSSVIRRYNVQRAVGALKVEFPFKDELKKTYAVSCLCRHIDVVQARPGILIGMEALSQMGVAINCKLGSSVPGVRDSQYLQVERKCVMSWPYPEIPRV